MVDAVRPGYVSEPCCGRSARISIALLPLIKRVLIYRLSGMVRMVFV